MGMNCGEEMGMVVGVHTGPESLMKISNNVVEKKREGELVIMSL